MGDSQDVTIVRIGAQGDGIAETEGEPRYIPFALPGEQWRLHADGRSEQLTQSPQRATPPCRHFGTCGGCIAQHMADDLYDAWKHDVVTQAFAHRGIGTTINPLRRVAPGSRRRAVFGVTHNAGAIALGFREEGQHRLVDLQECIILDRRIVAALPVLREIAAQLLTSRDAGARIVVTLLDHGLDVSFDITAKGASAESLQSLVQLASRSGIVRLSVGGDVIMRNGPATLNLGSAAVEVPPGIFLQAVPEAERVLTDLILAALPKTKHIADLFCGLGTFTFALAARARVLAIDSDKRAVAALTAGANGAKGLKPVTVKVRDLFREPLSARELDGIDAVVFDPPRAGAQAQCERLAKSKVKTIVAVSCNPATLARDARILIDGGYALADVTPIDQFVYSPHIEAVAVFRR